jgi:hypothetical protein
VRVIYDDESGDVIVLLQDVEIGKDSHGTHQFQKFGVTMYWDGHGGLLGIGFSQEVSVRPEYVIVPNGDKVPLRDQQPLSASARP